MTSFGLSSLISSYFIFFCQIFNTSESLVVTTSSYNVIIIIIVIRRRSRARSSLPGAAHAHIVTLLLSVNVFGILKRIIVMKTGHGAGVRYAKKYSALRTYFHSLFTRDGAKKTLRRCRTISAKNPRVQAVDFTIFVFFFSHGVTTNTNKSGCLRFLCKCRNFSSGRR